MIYNESPIFLNCFSRGGSNILWNMFLTHPEVCSPIRETLEIFRAGLAAPRIEGYLAILKSKQYNLFNQWWLRRRRRISKSAQDYIHRTLCRWKLKTVNDPEMKYKYENELYSAEEVEKARLVAKNNNGLVFLTDVFKTMYPEATFFALLRNPLALYESHRRRKIFRSVERFAEYYKRITQEMIEDERRVDHYYIVRFEDLMADPIGSMKRLYSLARLEFAQIRKVRFKAKPHWNKSREHTSVLPVNHHYWFEPGEVNSFLESDINQLQMDRVDRRDALYLRAELGELMERFNYDG